MTLCAFTSLTRFVVCRNVFAHRHLFLNLVPFRSDPLHDPSMALPFTWRWSRDSRSDRSVGARFDRATRIANELAVRGNLSRWEHDYLDVLSDLIEAYEAAHHPIPDLSGPEMLRHLLTERGTSQTWWRERWAWRPRRFPTSYVASAVSDASTSRRLPPTSTSPRRSSYPSPDRGNVGGKKGAWSAPAVGSR